MQLISELNNPFSVHDCGRLNYDSPSHKKMSISQLPELVNVTLHGRRDFADVFKGLQME